MSPIAITPDSAYSIAYLAPAPDQGGAMTSAAWPIANQAWLFPVTIPILRIVSYGLVITTSSGNLDLGIYDRNLARVHSLGSTPSPGTGYRSFAAAVALGAGPYWIAMAADNAVLAVRSFGNVAIPGRWGCLTMAAAFPLPPTITPAFPPVGQVLPAYGANLVTP